MAKAGSIDGYEAVDPSGSPFRPGHLAELFFAPRAFFESRIAIGAPPNVVLVALCLGVAYAIGRVERELLRAELGQPRTYWPAVGPCLTDSWVSFWPAVLAYGAVAGAVIWLLGGWWYTVRVRFSGDPSPDPRQARLVYVYSSFVAALPVCAAAVVQTAVYTDFGSAWRADGPWSALLLVFPFWACLVSYRGVTALFDVGKRRAALWFVALPWLVYASAIVLVGALAVLAGSV